MTDIEWRDIPGWEGSYMVSEDGQVRSMERLIKHPRGGTHLRKERILKGDVDRDGYRMYVLCREGTRRPVGAHVLVADAFLDGEGPLVRHQDGDPSNNHYTNLARGTYSENSLDAVRHGTHPMSSRQTCANGHEYTAATILRVGPGGRWRKCRICVNEQTRRWKLKKRQAS